MVRISALLLPLLAIVGMLLWRGPRSDDPEYRQTLDSLHQIALQQAALDRDVLRAHDGLLPNYDSLVSEIGALRVAADDLKRQGVAPGEGAGVLELATQIDREEEAVEQFKTDNALLQNSLAYVDLTSASLGESSADPDVALMVGRLANELLHLIRSPTGEIQQSVHIRLAGMQRLLASRAGDAALATAIGMLETHARLLSTIIPTVDRELRRIAAASTADAWARLSAAADARHLTEERLANSFQTATRLVATLLLGVLAWMAVLLRKAVRRQQQRARLEHAIGRVSMDLVGHYAPEGDGCMGREVEALGRAFGADAALLLLPDLPGSRWQWPPAEQEASGTWPARLFEPMREWSAPETDLVHIPATAGLPPGPLHDLFAGSRVAGCLGAVLRHQGRPLGLFLLGWTRPYPEAAADEGPLRMAAEVIGNAVRRRIEQQERAALEQRQGQARRLEALGTFASGIAHNFNNVIGAVLGYAEMAAQGLPMDSAVARYVREIHNAGERAQVLVSRILEFGTRGRSRRELVCVDDLLAETASMLRASLPPGAALAVEPGAPGGYGLAEPAQLQQAIVNLVRNAVEASRSGEQVIVRTSAEQVTLPRRLSHGTAGAGRYVRIAVVDTGVGMDAPTLERIFRPFFTTRPAGTGLGLATVREIIQDQGGVLDVRSRPGHGSAFELWLPAADVADALPGSRAPGDGQTVLVLAEHAAEVLRDEEMLAALSYEPIGFTSVAAVLAALSGTPNRFDAFLLGAGQAREADWALLAAITRSAPSRPILLTASAASEVESLPSDGVAEILMRPLRSASLSAALGSRLARRGAAMPTGDAGQPARLEGMP